MQIRELRDVEFPDCSSKCDLMDILGASKCGSLCPHKFPKYRTCKNCKWWKTEWGNVCDRVGDIRNSMKEFSIEMEIGDNQGLDCWLKTGPDFGCIHFEAKRVE